ncbi:MAG: cysteine hydrolase [Chthonomonadales bacterium]|nr:cysteine hydrolase [Chthonomonadales bacterium]
MAITLPVRFYRAVPTSNPVGLVEEPWDLDLHRTAFVELHCWNVGCPGGPPVPEDYWVDMGSPANHEAGWQIITEAILPCLQAARAVGMPVVHVQPERIGNRYKRLQPPLPEADARPTAPAWGWSPISDHQARRANRVHGEGFNDWEGWAQLDIAEPVKPVDGETMIVTTDQFDAWLRERGIDTLIYAGFCTNLCILDSPASMKPMAGRGYRCVLLRDATMAVEFPETLADRVHTQTAIRYVECWVGYTASVRDFIGACSKP